MIRGDDLGQLGLIGVFLAAILSHLKGVAPDACTPISSSCICNHPTVLCTTAGL